MDEMNVAAIVLVIIAALVLVVFLVKKNQKDKKGLNPDAQEAVTEEKTEQENERERL